MPFNPECQIIMTCIIISDFEFWDALNSVTYIKDAQILPIQQFNNSPDMFIPIHMEIFFSSENPIKWIRSWSAKYEILKVIKRSAILL